MLGIQKSTILTLTNEKFRRPLWLLVNKVHELHAFVNIFVETQIMDDVVLALSKIDAVEELYEVTGEFDIVALVGTSDIESFRDVLKNKIMRIMGVKSTITSIVLSTHKGPKCAT